MFHILIPEEWQEVGTSTNSLELVTFALPDGEGIVRISIAPSFGEEITLERLHRGTTIVQTGLRKLGR